MDVRPDRNADIWDEPGASQRQQASPAQVPPNAVQG